MFLASYRNTHERLGEFEIAVKTLGCQLVIPQYLSTSFVILYNQNFAKIIWS